MKRTKRSRTRKPAVSTPQAPLSFVSRHVISLGHQHITDIANTCRLVETELRQQGQDPLADTFKFLNLAQPRLTDKMIDCAIRPYFYFGLNHDKIPNQRAFQDAVRDKLTAPDALFIFDKMIRVYFQAFDFRIDGRNGKKTIRIALDTYDAPKPPFPTAIHHVFPWSPARKQEIYVGQLITWLDCKIFVAYGRLNPKMLTAFKRSISMYRGGTHGEFLENIESQLFTRFADPFDRHRRDQYLRKHTPKRHTILNQLAKHILSNDLSTPLQHLVGLAARQTNPDQINTFDQKLEDAYTEIVLKKHAYFTSIAQNIPQNALQSVLLCDPIRAAQHLQDLEQHPIQYLQLDATTLHNTKLPLNAPIHQVRSADLPPYAKDSLENAWKAYVIEQRLLKILRNFQHNTMLDDVSAATLIFQLADSRFLDTNIIDLPLEKRFRNHFLRAVDAHVYDTALDLPLNQITLNHLLNGPAHHDSFDFTTLPKGTRNNVTDALLRHLAEWRQMTAPHPPSTPHLVDPAAQKALSALDEINDLFES